MFDHPLYNIANRSYQSEYSGIIDVDQIQEKQNNFEYLSTNFGDYYGLPANLYISKKLENYEIALIIDILRNQIAMNRFNFTLRGFQDANLISKIIVEFGLKSSLILARKISLSQSLEVIRASFRKSYKSLINQQNRLFESQILYCDSFSQIDWDGFRLLHFKSAKRETRSIKSWDLQAANIIDGSAYTVLLKRDNNIISGGYFLLSNEAVYYGVSATDRDDKGALMGSHLMIYKAIEFAQAILKKETFILSEDEVSIVDNKIQNIMKFKYGFGGENEIYLRFFL